MKHKNFPELLAIKMAEKPSDANINKDENCTIALRKHQQWIHDRSISKCIAMKALQQVKSIHLCKPSFCTVAYGILKALALNKEVTGDPACILKCQLKIQGWTSVHRKPYSTHFSAN